MADSEVVADSSGYNSSGEEDSEASDGAPLELYGRRELGLAHSYNVIFDMSKARGLDWFT